MTLYLFLDALVVALRRISERSHPASNVRVGIKTKQYQSVVDRATYCYRDTANQTAVARYVFVSLRLEGYLSRLSLPQTLSPTPQLLTHPVHYLSHSHLNHICILGVQEELQHLQCRLHCYWSLGCCKGPSTGLSQWLHKALGWYG